MFFFYYLVLLLIIRKIISDCGTDQFLNDEDHLCYFLYEKPNYYKENETNILKPCPSPCYECSDNSIYSCLSCQRGYFYNDTINSCQQCPSNEYKFIKDGTAKCQYLNNFNCELKITECTGEIFTDHYECPREYPLLSTNNRNECILDYFTNPSDYEISNKIIKKQWMNNIIHLPQGSSYVAMDYNDKKDLIIETYEFSSVSPKKDRYFYGIKNNGRPLFFNSLTQNFNYQKNIFFNNMKYVKSSFQLIRIKLFNESEKEYYLSFSLQNIEVADIYNNIVTNISFTEMFSYDNSIVAVKYFTLLELKNEENIFLFGFVVRDNYQYFLIIQKIKFLKPDISEENSFELINELNINNNIKISNSRTLTCIQIITFNIIECLYVNTTGYFIVGIFDQNSLNLNKTFSIDENLHINVKSGELENFHRCIYFKNETSILAYITDSTSDLVYIQITNLIFQSSEYKLENYLNRIITINSQNKFKFDVNFNKVNLIKINDNKFSLIIPHSSDMDLFIILFDLFDPSNLLIRYYNIPLNMYNIRILGSVVGFNFKGFLGIAIPSQGIHSSIIREYLLILSYINGTDSDIINLESYTTIILSDYINNLSIENNLFGYTFIGIKLLKFPNSNELGTYYYSQEKKITIVENNILSPDDVIIFAFDYSNLIKNGTIYTIEMTGVIQEPSYSESENYAIDIENIGSDNQLLYQQNVLEGKTCFYNFTVPESLIKEENSCNNCKICNKKECFECLNGYYLVKGTNNCENTKIERYYFNNESQQYENCHESCRYCSVGPENNNTNCEICINDYYKIINTNNCVYKEEQIFGYYFDENEELFLNCHEKCQSCSSNKKGITSLNCLSCEGDYIFYDYSHNCLDCAFQNKYVNYYQYDCLDYIPDGYYLLNNANNIIDKCYISCKHCSEKGTLTNHKCTECSEAYPYNYNNGEKCLDDCSKENLYLDKDNLKCYEYCSNIDKNQYKRECISSENIPKNYKLNNNIFKSICQEKKLFEFNNECYEKCPEGTKLDESDLNKYMCICKNLYYLNENEEIVCINGKICPDEYPYLKIDSYECTNCPVKYNDTCYNSCPEGTCLTQINKKLDKCVSNFDKFYYEISNICFEYFEVILDKIDELNNNNIVINNYEGVTINLYEIGTNLNDMKEEYENLTFIDLNECAETLRGFYHLNDSEKLYVVSIDYLNKISNNAINSYNFEIYTENKTKLNHEICNNNFISITSPIINLDLVNFDKAEIFSEQGYDIYNFSSEFYNDKCTRANINGNDIIITDRINDIYPHNIDFCPKNCTLENVEIESKRFNCLCNLSFTNNIDIPESSDKEEPNLKESSNNYFTYILDKLNYEIFNCGNIIYKSNIIDYLKNIGFILGFSVIIFNIINCQIFYCYYLGKLRIKIFKSLPNKQKLVEKIRKSNLEKTGPRKKNIKKFGHRGSNTSKEKINKSPKKYKKSLFQAKVTNDKNSSLKTNDLFIREKFKKREKNKILKSSKEILLVKDDKEVDEDEYNDLPYYSALKLDKRNIFSIFLSIIKMKINIITILFYTDEFSHYSLGLTNFSFEFLFNYFINALLYSDEIVSKKYHNNGKLEFLTSISLSLGSNIITGFVCWGLEKLSLYNEYLVYMTKNVKIKRMYVKVFQKLYSFIKFKIALFYIIIFLMSVIITHYLFIFCYIFQKSQISLLTNYFLGVVESLLTTFGVSIVSCILRYFGLKYKLKSFYRTSVFLFNKL